MHSSSSVSCCSDSQNTLFEDSELHHLLSSPPSTAVNSSPLSSPLRDHFSRKRPWEPASPSLFSKFIANSPKISKIAASVSPPPMSGFPTIARPYITAPPPKKDESSSLDFPVNNISNSFSQLVLPTIYGLRLRESSGRMRRETPVSFRRELRSFESSEFDVHMGNEYNEYELPLCCSYSHQSNSGMLLAVGDEEGNITIFDTKCDNQSPQEIKKRWVGHPNAIFDISWSPCDTKIMTASGDRCTKIFDAETSSVIAVLKGHSQSVRSAACDSYDPNIIATAGRDGSIKLWDIRCSPAGVINGDRYQRPILTILDAHLSESRKKTGNGDKNLEKNSVTAVLFLKHNNRMLASAGACDGLIKYWDIRYGSKNTMRSNPPVAAQSKPLPGVVRQHGISALSIDNDGNRLVAMSRDGGLYEYLPQCLGTPIGVMRWPSQRCDSFYLRASLSPDGRFVACGSSDNNIYVWEFGGAPAPVILKAHEGEVSAVSWNKVTEKQIASCSDDGTIRIWNMKAEKTVYDNPANKHLRSSVQDALLTDGHLIGAVTQKKSKTQCFLDPQKCSTPASRSIPSSPISERSVSRTPSQTQIEQFMPLQPTSVANTRPSPRQAQLSPTFPFRLSRESLEQLQRRNERSPTRNRGVLQEISNDQEDMSIENRWKRSRGE